ncbi:MAG: WXG100 family type VII secretion target [Mycobacteriaceae bacterium]
MSDMKYNFAGIEAQSGALLGAVNSTHGLLDEGKQSLTKLAAAWGGSGSEAYQAVQARWDQASLELNQALQNLAQKISEAGQTMSQTESGVAGMFS